MELTSSSRKQLDEVWGRGREGGDGMGAVIAFVKYGGGEGREGMVWGCCCFCEVWGRGREGGDGMGAVFAFVARGEFCPLAYEEES